MKLITIIAILLSLSIVVQSTREGEQFIRKFQKENNSIQVGDGFNGIYKVESVTKSVDKYFGTLTYDGPLNTFMADNNKVIKNLNFLITLNTDFEVTLKISPQKESFFELPQKSPFPYEKNTQAYQPEQPNYQIIAPVQGQQFHFAVIGNKGSTVFDTTNMPFVFTQLYVQFGTQVFGEEFWGWGERRAQWGFDSGQYTIWNYDYPVNSSYGKVAQQTYGTHPVWLQRSVLNAQKQYIPTSYHMVYLRTSYGLELDYRKNSEMVIQMSGGPIELKFFVYDTPKQNIAAYHRYINGWVLHPFWSMGFQICRWGLPNSEKWADMWYKANDNKVSFDVIWSDIDYMQDYEDFTISNTYDVKVMKDVCNLDDPLGVRWVPIIDAGVKYTGDSGMSGVKKDLFVKSAVTGNSLIGCVWPGAAYFVDWNNPQSIEFWKNGLKNITAVYNAPQPSGIWLDMNEPSSFTENDVGEVFNPNECVPLDANMNKQEYMRRLTTGEKYRNIIQRMADFMNKKSKLSARDINNNWGYPWSPMGDLSLSFKTIATSGKHYNQKDAQYVNIDNFEITEYEFHNLYGFLEGVATNEYLQESGFELPFIITRASFAGQGAFTQHWTGDNYAAWDQLQNSLGDIFNFQLFGIPMTAGDVCGFAGTTNAQLCARWYQMGAWYPFFRAHNANDAPDQFPWSFPNQPYVLNSSTKAINLRYSLMKWYYMIFVREQPYGTVFNPLFFDYPEDEMAQNEAHQALIGSEIMISPVLSEGNESTQQTDIKVYFPGSASQQWYRLDSEQNIDGGSVQSFTVPFDAVSPWFLKGGKAIVQQPQALEGVQRARHLNNSFRLILAIDQNNESEGNMLGLGADYSDKTVKQYCVGENNNCIVNIKASVYSFGAQDEIRVTLNITPQSKNTNYIGDIIIDSIVVYGTKFGRVEQDNLNLTFNKSNTREIISIDTQFL